MWDMWDHHNEILHASIPHPWKIQEISELDRQIEEEYKRGYNNMLRKDYEWLKQPLPQTVKS
jgi:hypothetical protein